MLLNVEINSRDESYPNFLQWIYHYEKAQNAGVTKSSGALDALLTRFTPRFRSLAVQTEQVEHANGAINSQLSLTPGTGKHIIRYQNAFVWVNRVREEKSIDMRTGKPWETVTLTMLYSQRHVLNSIFAEAHALAEKAHEGKTKLYTSRGVEWGPFGNPRQKRPLQSVILDRGIKDRIVEDVEDFLKSGSWYRDRGIPYRRGYLLYGPPGSGKSSFIQALAGHLNYDIAILNLAERGLTDDRLNALLTVMPPRTLVLLEDADSAFANRRQTDSDGYRGANVTFSGLLNALDGVASAEERVVFLTTNHVDRLDPALIRPGRVDMTVRLGQPSRWQVAQLWDRFYGDLEQSDMFKPVFLNRLEQLGIVEGEGEGKDVRDCANPTSVAALQGLFLYHKGDMKGAIAAAEGLLATAEDCE